MIQCTLEISNKLGLHARASAKLIDLASRYESEITLECNNKQANAKSILDVMMLGASQGSSIKLMVNGNDEQEAVTAISALIQDRFGESE